MFYRIVADPIEDRHELLGAVDSIEILSHRTSSIQPVVESRNSPPSFQSFTTISSEQSHDSGGSSALNEKMPIYMKIPPLRCPKFVKMSEEEWMQLQALENLTKSNRATEESEKRSSIQFEGLFDKRNSSKGQSKRNSILKWPSMEVPNETHLQNDALQPIRQKCLEALNNMNVQEVLRILCEENDVASS